MGEVDFHYALIDKMEALLGGAQQKALTDLLTHEDYLVRLKAFNSLEPESNNRAAILTGGWKHKLPADLAGLAESLIRDKQERRWVLETTRGEVVILLQANYAPITVANIIRLTEQGYFTKMTLHRVVPNFVMQGGDPRGDGSGGPGYAIPCEVNMLRFARGSVGMALSGKDTGGSQFFICHSSQPHLDGGYTIFGQVEQGMDMVDMLEEGNIIERATIR